MEHTVWSFKTAIRKGYEPRLYTYNPQQIPLGEFDAVLDFKTWSKRIIAINCYFTKIATKEKFVVTIYCNNHTGKYNITGSDVNFADCAVNASYHICIQKNNKGRIFISSAKLIQHINQSTERECRL